MSYNTILLFSYSSIIVRMSLSTLLVILILALLVYSTTIIITLTTKPSL